MDIYYKRLTIIFFITLAFVLVNYFGEINSSMSSIISDTPGIEQYFIVKFLKAILVIFLGMALVTEKKEIWKKIKNYIILFVILLLTIILYIFFSSNYLFSNNVIYIVLLCFSYLIFELLNKNNKSY